MERLKRFREYTFNHVRDPSFLYFNRIFPGIFLNYRLGFVL